MREAYSVTVINRYIRQLIEGEGTLSHIYVRGEVSNCKYHSSGHIYFTLKDQESALACVMFSGQRARGLKFRMTNGMQVIVFGSVSVYERDGRYQLYAVSIMQEGIGYLYEKYAQLKETLGREGLFDISHKKQLPSFPKTIGIVTASTGAAIQDIMNISRRRNPYIQLVLYPAKVQGEGAAQTIVRGIRTLDDYGVDIMIVGRGGGSIEDLWAFNEEIVARAIYDCRTPVISAVGHESDWTIADEVADLRAPTPSAAAELAVPDVIALISRISEDGVRLNQAMARRISDARQRVGGIERTLRHMGPETKIAQRKQTLMHLSERLWDMMSGRLTQSRHSLELSAAALEGLSPVKKLSGGYAFLAKAKDDLPVTSVTKVASGDVLQAHLRDGRLLVRVEDIESGSLLDRRSHSDCDCADIDDTVIDRDAMNSAATAAVVNETDANKTNVNETNANETAVNDINANTDGNDDGEM